MSSPDPSKKRPFSVSDTDAGNGRDATRHCPAAGAPAAALDAVAAGERPPPQKWVQCASCSQWRRVPYELDDAAIPDDWTCAQNVWDARHAACAVPQALTDDQIDAILALHDAGDAAADAHLSRRSSFSDAKSYTPSESSDAELGAMSDSVSDDEYAAPAPDASAPGSPPRRSNRLAGLTAATRAAGKEEATPARDSDDDKICCHAPGCTNYFFKTDCSSRGGDFCTACKKGGINVDGHPFVWSTHKIWGWRPKGTAPALAKKADIPADPDGYAGWRARLTLAGPGVDVRVKHYNPKPEAWVVAYSCEGSEINLYINKDEGRLQLLEPPKLAGPLAPTRADALAMAELTALAGDPKLRGIDLATVLFVHDALYSTDPADALHSTDPDKVLALANEIAKKDAAWRVGKVPVSSVPSSENEAWIWTGLGVGKMPRKKDIECQAPDCKTKNAALVRANKNYVLSLCPAHSALVVERPVDTGDPKLECWCLCKNTGCRKRVRPDAFLGKDRKLYAECDECRAVVAAAYARAREDKKPVAKAAIAALVQQADDVGAAVTEGAVAKVAANWSNFTSVDDVKAWAKEQPEAACVKTGTTFICAAVKEARARFAEQARKGGGGSAE